MLSLSCRMRKMNLSRTGLRPARAITGEIRYVGGGEVGEHRVLAVGQVSA
jgi:hypothetical protein